MLEQYVTIRKLRPEDLVQAANLEKQIFSEPWSEKAFADSLQREDTDYLAAYDTLENKLAGYCGLYRMSEEAELTNVAVDPEYRRKHVAEEILVELFNRAAASGVKKIVLEVRKSNQPAIRLYMKLGFSPCGMRKEFYRKPTEDAVIMSKALR